MFCLFELRPYIPVNTILVMSGHFPWLKQYKAVKMKCLADAYGEIQTRNIVIKSDTLPTELMVLLLTKCAKEKRKAMKEQYVYHVFIVCLFNTADISNVDAKLICSLIIT